MLAATQLNYIGYIEGQNIRFEFRSDDGQISRLFVLAAELTRLKVDMIVAWFTPAAIAAKQATHDIPIVCALCGDMVGTGLVAGAAGEGNATGNDSGYVQTFFALGLIGGGLFYGAVAALLLGLVRRTKDGALLGVLTVAMFVIELKEPFLFKYSARPDTRAFRLAETCSEHEKGRRLQVLIDHTQQAVNGWVRVKLYKGNVIVVGRDSKTDSLFDPTIATFEDDKGAYDQKDAGGFIKLNALRMRIAANLKNRK